MAEGTVQGTPSWLRATNNRTAMSLLLEHGPLTRNRIGQLSGLSKPTAAQMVARLEEGGLIEVFGEVSGGPGPNAVSYAVRADRFVGVAVDVGTAVMSSTLVDAVGTVFPVVSTPVGPASERTAIGDVSAAIESACAAAGVDRSAISLAEIGVQAAVAPRTDELAFTDTLPGWPSHGIRAHLEEGLGLEVSLENDVNLAAVAERGAGTAADVDGFALLWLGDGLGLAIDIAGQVYRGASGGAGEIGYLAAPVGSEEPGADGTGAGDLTSLFGAAAADRLASEFGDDSPRHLAPRIAAGLVPVLAVLDPERVVLGGPVGVRGGPRLASLVADHLERTTRWSPDVVATRVPELAVLAGARELLLRGIRRRLFDEVSRITN
jgi:predicted NBD/HSP70 family sugar kinase